MSPALNAGTCPEKSEIIASRGLYGIAHSGSAAGGKPKDSGTVAGVAHRGWAKVKLSYSLAPSVRSPQEVRGLGIFFAPFVTVQSACVFLDILWRIGKLCSVASPRTVSDMSSPQQNHLLSALPAEVQNRLLPYLELVPMFLGKVLYESGDNLHHVYFPTDSIVSLLYVLLNGASATPIA